LYSLGKSHYQDRFILKGAMLFMLWSDHPHRSTRDVDFLGFGDSSEASLQAIFRDLCDIQVEDDGLILIADSVQVEVIRDAIEYGGTRVHLFGDTAGARVPIHSGGHKCRYHEKYHVQYFVVEHHDYCPVE
jgi:hypothetical protein